MYPATSDPRVVKAYAHPVRVQILEALEARTASPSEIADELGASVGSVSYHVQQLVALGQLRLVKQVERRGAVEHFYTTTEPPTLSDDDWAAMPRVLREAVIGHTLEKVGAHVLAAAREGGFHKPDVHVSRTALRLDPEAWAEVATELAGVLERIDAIGRRSTARDNGAPGRDVRDATVLMMLFEGPAEKPAVTRRHRL